MLCAHYRTSGKCQIYIKMIQTHWKKHASNYRSQRWHGSAARGWPAGWLQGTQPRGTHFISGCLTSKQQTASDLLAAPLACSLPPAARRTAAAQPGHAGCRAGGGSARPRLGRGLVLLLPGHGGEGATQLQHPRMAGALGEGGGTAEQPGVAGMERFCSCKTLWRFCRRQVGSPLLALCQAVLVAPSLLPAPAFPREWPPASPGQGEAISATSFLVRPHS